MINYFRLNLQQKPQIQTFIPKSTQEKLGQALLIYNQLKLEFPTYKHLLAHTFAS